MTNPPKCFKRTPQKYRDYFENMSSMRTEVYIPFSSTASPVLRTITRREEVFNKFCLIFIGFNIIQQGVKLESPLFKMKKEGMNGERKKGKKGKRKRRKKRGGRKDHFSY